MKVKRQDQSLQQFSVHNLDTQMSTINCCLSYMNLEGGANNTPAHSQNPSRCSITIETKAWFIYSQIKATAVVGEKDYGNGGNQKKTLKVSIIINNNEESVMMVVWFYSPGS